MNGWRPHGDTAIEILSVDANLSPTVVQDSLTIVRRVSVPGRDERPQCLWELPNDSGSLLRFTAGKDPLPPD